MALIGDVAFFNLSKQRAEPILVLWRMTAKSPALWTQKFARGASPCRAYCSGYAVAHKHGKQAYALARESS